VTAIHKPTPAFFLVRPADSKSRIFEFPKLVPFFNILTKTTRCFAVYSKKQQVVLAALKGSMNF
jgi:hypothetical protein